MGWKILRRWKCFSIYLIDVFNCTLFFWPFGLCIHPLYMSCTLPFGTYCIKFYASRGKKKSQPGLAYNAFSNQKTLNTVRVLTRQQLKEQLHRWTIDLNQIWLHFVGGMLTRLVKKASWGLVSWLTVLCWALVLDENQAGLGNDQAKYGSLVAQWQ